MRRRISISITAALLLLTAFTVRAEARVTIPLTVSTLTADGTATATATDVDGLITASAPTTNAPTSNLRQQIFLPNTPDVANPGMCTTFASQSSGAAQEGIVLRSTGNHLITVTKNVIYGLQWVVNVHVWDLTVPVFPFKQIGGFDMGAVLLASSHTAPFPWRMCARAIDGTVTFKVWVLATQSEPSWTDAAHSRTVLLPAGYLAPGKSGWFAGHLPAGGSIQYRDTTFGKWCLNFISAS